MITPLPYSLKVEILTNCRYLFGVTTLERLVMKCKDAEGSWPRRTAQLIVPLRPRRDSNCNKHIARDHPLRIARVVYSCGLREK